MTTYVHRGRPSLAASYFLTSCSLTKNSNHHLCTLCPPLLTKRSLNNKKIKALALHASDNPSSKTSLSCVKCYKTSDRSLHLSLSPTNSLPSKASTALSRTSCMVPQDNNLPTTELDPGDDLKIQGVIVISP
ncbi:hypothetical protein LguiA_008406 [Lonicera macranthoides]